MTVSPSPTDESAPPAVRLVNGVFEGGGVKGIAYAGALRALRERGLWFASVAGASAGAVTATLIASGMDLDDLEQQVPKALASAAASPARRVGAAVLGRRSSIYDSSTIRAWIDETLHERIGKRDPSPVTFEELVASTGIELYVVAMDLATGTPSVFCRWTTPTVDVAGAVAASSAIPGAFPAARGVLRSPTDGTTVHAMVDGGTWANYPQFVFQDQSFRTWLRATSEAHDRWSDAEQGCWKDECARPTVGFVLRTPRALEPRTLVGMVPVRGAGVDAQFDRGPTATAPQPGLHALHLLLANDPVRYVVVAAMLTWIVLSLLTAGITTRRLSVFLDDWVPDWLYPFALVGVMTLMVMAVVVAIGSVLVILLLGRLIADTVVPTLKALVGVPTGVAPWIGLGSDSVVIDVPCDAVGTLDFTADADTRSAAVRTAYDDVCGQLADPVLVDRLEALFAGRPAAEARPRLRPAPIPEVVEPDRDTAVGIGSVFVAVAVLSVLGWWGVNVADRSGVWPLVGSLAVGALPGIAAMVHLVRRAAQRASARSQTGVVTPVPPPGPRARITVAVGLVAIAGGAALSALAMEARTSHVGEAVVTEGRLDGGYTVDVPGPAGPFSLRTDERLRMGESVIVEFDETADEARLEGALEDWRFPVAIAAWTFGIGAIASGVRRHRWDVRCRRLAALSDRLAAPPA